MRQKLPAVPLLYISHNAILIEQPDDKLKHEAQEKKTLHIAHTSEIQREALKKMKEQELGVNESVVKKRKRKGPKGPNPLSCKKRKTQDTEKETTQTQAVAKKRRRRKRRK